MILKCIHGKQIHIEIHPEFTWWDDGGIMELSGCDTCRLEFDQTDKQEIGELEGIK